MVRACWGNEANTLLGTRGLSSHSSKITTDHLGGLPERAEIISGRDILLWASSYLTSPCAPQSLDRLVRGVRSSTQVLLWYLSASHCASHWNLDP